MSSIPFFARRRLCSTFNAQEVGQLRAALQGAGVEFVIQQDRQNGSFFGIGLQLVPPSVEYIIYVHEDDFELAQALTDIFFRQYADFIHRNEDAPN